MKYQQFGIIVTDRCSAACKFCGWRCSPRNRGVIPLELAKSAMDQAAALGIRQRLGLTGGEALLYPELVAEILSYGKSAGFQASSIASNGFWGAWPREKIDQMLSLIEKNCNLICFSMDSFHAEYVPEQSVWNAATAAAEHGIRVSFSVADVCGERGAGPYLASLSEKALKHSYSLYPLERIGNAENLPEELFVKTLSREDEWGCPAGGLISVMYDGRVFPCCNPGIFDTDFSLGSLQEHSLQDLLSNSRGIKRLRILQDPKYFRELMEWAAGELKIEIPEQMTSACELCYRVFRSQERLESLEPGIDAIYQKMVLDYFFNPPEKETALKEAEP
jgi:MoaA/NifB/PqqE/SkfB family radical SAM enzyme